MKTRSLQQIQQWIQQIEADPGKTITTAVLRKMGLRATHNTTAQDYFLARFGVQPIGKGKFHRRGYTLIFDKRQLLAALRRDVEQKNGLLAVSSPTAPTPAPDLPALLERFQRDFAATMDAFHQDLADRLDRQQVARDQGGRQLFAALKKLNDCAPPVPLAAISAGFTTQQEANSLLFKKLDALTTLTEAVLAFAKPNGAASERIETQMDKIAEYFQIHQQANRIIFKKIEALGANVEKLNQELGVTA